MFRPGKRPGEVEFISLMAVLIALLALTIDAILPALPDIGHELNVQDANQNQWVVSSIFIGFAIGQIFYGPLSDSFGRKNPIYLGLAIYCAGSLIAIFSWNFEIMLIGRFIQGLGAAGPKIVTIALIRDQYEGRNMARIMSFIMALFILAPAIAPALGQGILLFFDWRMIFILLLAAAMLALAWFAMRQPETLPLETRVPFSIKHIIDAVNETCRHRVAFGYTLTMGFSFGAFIGYLNSAQQIFQNIFGLGEKFPLYFGALALAIGLASIVNSKIVMRFGMRYLCWRALLAITLLSILFNLFIQFINGPPPLWLFMAWGLLIFFSTGILFGNFNAMAMEPLGHIAGVAAAVIGAISTLIAVIFGITIGQLYDATVDPLVAGFALLGALSMLIMYISDKKARQAL